MIWCLEKYVKYAEDVSVILGLENHNHNGFAKTAGDVLHIISEFDPPWLKHTLDTGNYLDIYPSIEKTASLAVNVHAKIYYPAGCSGFLTTIYHPPTKEKEKELDYDRILKILKGVQYNGFLTLEYVGEEEEETALPRVAKYLEKIMGTH